MTSTPAFDLSRDGFTVARGLWSQELCVACKAEIQRLVSEKGDHGGVLVGLAAASPFFAEAIREPSPASGYAVDDAGKGVIHSRNNSIERWR